MTTLYGYARVSREDQELALQTDALSKAGVEARHMVSEKTGGTKERPGLKALLARLKPGDSLVVWKLDRIGRNALDVMETAESLGKRGVSLVILTLGLDTSTPVGAMVLGIMAQLAQFERAQLIERTKAGLEAAKRRGAVGGRPPGMTHVQKQEAERLISEGRSLGDVSRITGINKSTVFRGVRQVRGQALMVAEARAS